MPFRAPRKRLASSTALDVMSFGGIRYSGMGAYNGKAGFDAPSNPNRC